MGWFAAKAFLEPERFGSRRISLAGDELTFEQAKKLCERVTGVELQTTWKWFSGLVLLVAKELGTMFRWLHEHGFGADLEEVRREHPGVKDFRGWLETENLWINSKNKKSGEAL